VLVPVYRRQDGGLMVVLIRRARGGAHGGQLTLPRRPQEQEVGEVVELPVADLARPEVRVEEVRDFPTWPAPGGSGCGGSAATRSGGRSPVWCIRSRLRQHSRADLARVS
jgi:hypothetical protein